MFKTAIRIVITLLIITLFFGCPTPFNANTLSVMKDLDAPELIITTPSNYSEYATVLEVKGEIRDSSLNKLFADDGLKLSYNISGTSINGSISIDTETLRFSELIDVSTLSGSKVIEFSTTDLNGNTINKSVNIVKPENGGDISDYIVIPGNRQVVISWDDVPGAESYSIFESYFGRTVLPEEISGTSYTWTGLENFETYSFRLTAHMADNIGDDAVSEFITRMPLGNRSLAPSVAEKGYKSITLEWQAYSDFDKYVIERSLNMTGPWETRRILSGSEFTDDWVEHDTEYFYRVYPFLFDNIKSDVISAVPGRFGYEETGSYEFDGLVHDVAVEDGIAYLACSADGLQIVDISDPSNSKLMGSCVTGGSATGVDIDGSYAYVSDYTEGLIVIDISNPSAVNDNSIVGICDTASYANDVAVEGDYAYIGENVGIEIIDISEPDKVDDDSVIKFVDYIYNVHSIAVADNKAYLATTGSGFQVYDVSNPNSPFQLGSTISLLGYDLEIFEGYIYIAARTLGLQVRDLSVPYTLVGSCDTAGEARGVAVAGDFAFVADYDEGLQIIDVSTPTGISDGSLIASCDTTGSSYAAAVSGNHVCLADGEAGLQIIDVASPSSQNFMGRYSDSSVYSVTVTDGIAHVSDGWGYRRIDVSSQGSPSDAGLYSAGVVPKDVVIAGNYAYVAAASSGLKIVDASDSSSILGSCDGANPWGLAVAGNYAYIAADSSGLQVADISDPETAAIIGSCDTSDSGGTASGIAVRGNYAYLADGNEGLKIIDISDPHNLSSSSIVGSYNTSGNAEAVTVAGDFAYIADGDSGLVVINISDPNAVTDASNAYSCNTDDYAYSVTVAGSYAYVSDGDEGLQVIDVSQPSRVSDSSIIGHYATTATARDVAIAGSYAYIAEGSGGLEIIRLGEITE